jgi:hypothetical protein
LARGELLATRINQPTGRLESHVHESFSTPAKFGIMPEVIEFNRELSRTEWRTNCLCDETINDSHRFVKSQRTGRQTIRRALCWLPYNFASMTRYFFAIRPS